MAARDVNLCCALIEISWKSRHNKYFSLHIPKTNNKSVYALAQSGKHFYSDWFKLCLAGTYTKQELSRGDSFHISEHTSCLNTYNFEILS